MWAWLEVRYELPNELYASLLKTISNWPMSSRANVRAQEPYGNSAGNSAQNKAHR